MRENNPPGDPPLMGLRLAILGPGRVGASVAHWCHRLGAELVALAGRRRATAEAGGLADLVDLDRVWSELETFDPSAADLLLIAVSDVALSEVAEQLAGRPPAPVVLHASGLHDASVLAPLGRRSSLGSLHPLRAFATVSTRLEEVSGTCFAIDGDPPARALAERLARAFGGDPVVIDGERRLLYHLAASVAAGGVTTVLSWVDELIAEADLPRSLFSSYLGLTRSALAPLDAGIRPAAAITGPAARGDDETVARQIERLDAVAPALGPTVRALMAETRRQRRRVEPSEQRRPEASNASAARSCGNEPENEVKTE
ncbi:MAG: DUF2520 domain-containing protein [Acidobacteriota bacterium]